MSPATPRSRRLTQGPSACCRFRGAEGIDSSKRPRSCCDVESRQR
jgi:hypothetical protein